VGWDETRSTRPFNKDGTPRKIRRDKGSVKKPFCPRGHNVAIEGRDLHGACTACRKQIFSPKAASKYRAKHTEKIKAHARRTKTGWSPEEYEAAFVSQKGLCAICGRPPISVRLSADHCHETGKLRQLLCRKCNAALGLFHESPSLLLIAAEYLINHGKTVQ
jgi:hypothetical protein